MKTRAKRFAAIFVAAVMTAAIAVPAFAATDPVGEKSGDALTEMTFDKIVEADADTYQPDETISFTVSAAEPTNNETAGDPAMPVVTGKAGGVSLDSAISTQPSEVGTKTYTGTFKFDKSKFEQPGIYKYLVKENAIENPDMKLAADQYLYVYVRRSDAGAIEVYAASLVDTDTTAANNKSGAFKNVYKTNGNTENVFKDLIIKKTVAGSFGETDKEFNFKLSITSSDRKYYVVKKGDTSATYQVGTEYEFTLKNGETIKVENLSSSDKYTIVETDAGQNGYTTTYKTGDSAATSSAPTDKSMSATADVTEEVINTRNAVNPTGIFMNYAPYICMIAAAAVLAFVFLRRKEDI